MNNILNNEFLITFNELTKTLFGLFCHQDPGIILKLNNEQLPLCPRCTGLHTGFFLAFILYKIIGINFFRIWIFKSPYFLFFIISITYLHWLGGWLNIIEQEIILRFVTGMLSGSGFYLLIISFGIPDLNVNFWKLKSKEINSNYRLILFTIILLPAIINLPVFGLLLIFILNISIILSQLFKIMRKLTYKMINKSEV